MVSRSIGLVGLLLLLSCNPSSTGSVSIQSFQAQPSPAVLPAEVELSWSLNNPGQRELTCYIDAEDDQEPDYEIFPCASQGSLVHSYAEWGALRASFWVVGSQGEEARAQVPLQLQTSPSIDFLDHQEVAQLPLQQRLNWEISDPDAKPGELTCSVFRDAGPSAWYTIKPCSLEGSHLLTFDQVGLYQITFAVQDGNGLRDEQELQVGVGIDLPPQVELFRALPSQGLAPLSVKFSWVLDDPEKQPLSCKWQSGEGGSQVLNPCPNQGSLQHIYTLPGSYTAILEATDASGQTTVAESRVAVRSLQSETYDIQLVWGGEVPPEYQAVFQSAAQHWEQIIAQGLYDVTTTVPDRACRGGNLPYVGPIDDVLIEIRTPALDGPGEILGSAGPCMLREDGLPYFGLIRLDLADLAALYQQNAMEYLVFHEMGHVLGFASLWGVGNQWLVGRGGSNPLFVGPAAMQAYAQQGGVGGVPVENLGPLGTRDNHWRESVFENEVMTGYLDQGTNYLSRMTIGSMADLGYQVNYAAADTLRFDFPLDPSPWLKRNWHEILRPQWVGPWPSQPLEEWLRSRP